MTDTDKPVAHDFSYLAIPTFQRLVHTHATELRKSKPGVVFLAFCADHGILDVPFATAVLLWTSHRLLHIQLRHGDISLIPARFAHTEMHAAIAAALYTSLQRPLPDAEGWALRAALLKRIAEHVSSTRDRVLVLLQHAKKAALATVEKETVEMDPTQARYLTYDRDWRADAIRSYGEIQTHVGLNPAAYDSLYRPLYLAVFMHMAQMSVAIACIASSEDDAAVLDDDNYETSTKPDEGEDSDDGEP